MNRLYENARTPRASKDITLARAHETLRAPESREYITSGKHKTQKVETQRNAPLYSGDITDRLKVQRAGFAGGLRILGILFMLLHTALDITSIVALGASSVFLVMSLFGLAVPLALTTAVYGAILAAAAIFFIAMDMLKGPIMRHIRVIDRLSRVIRAREQRGK